MFMKQIPEHLEKEINEAISLKENLSKKFFNKKLSYKEILFIEYKCEKNILSEQDLNTNEIIVHFDSDKDMNILKIKNHKLKEYYFNYFFDENNTHCVFKGTTQQCIEELKNKNLNEIKNGFYFNGNYYHCEFCSVSSKTNEITDYYFCSDSLIFSDFEGTIKEPGFLILRFDAKTFKLNQFYFCSVCTYQYRIKFNLNIFQINYYYDLSSNLKYIGLQTL